MTTKQLKELREEIQKDLMAILYPVTTQDTLREVASVLENHLRPKAKPEKGRTFILTFKNPDAIDNSLMDEPTAVQKAAKAFLPKYVRDGEYLDLEVDVDNKTFEVLKTPRGC